MKKPAKARAMAAANFHDTAFENLTWAVACVDDAATPLDWPLVSKLFYDLEHAYDRLFHFYEQITGGGIAKRQKKVDAVTERRQVRLAATLWSCDKALARQYADVLRKVEIPAGLSDAEKRTAFLQEIERREPNKAPARKTATKELEQIATKAADKATRQNLSAVTQVLEQLKTSTGRIKNRARTARRNGNKSDGRPPKITPEQRRKAVKTIMTRMRDNSALTMATACRFYLKETPLPIKAERLRQLVREARRPPSGRN